MAGESREGKVLLERVNRFMKDQKENRTNRLIRSREGRRKAVPVEETKKNSRQ